MRIKLFESFDDLSKVKSDINDIFVELSDSGFDIRVITYFTKNEYFVDIERRDKKLFDTTILNEYDLMLRDYLEGVLPGFKLEYLFFSNNREFKNDEYIRLDEIATGYSPRLVIKVIGQDENS